VKSLYQELDDMYYTLLNSANAGQMTAEFSKCWADACGIQQMLGR